MEHCTSFDIQERSLRVEVSLYVHLKVRHNPYKVYRASPAMQMVAAPSFVAQPTKIQ